MNISKNIRKLSIVTLSVKNGRLPLCINCKFLIEPKINYPYESFPDETMSKCQKFGTINLVTGEIEYKYASHCRQNDDYKNIDKFQNCGINGLLFEKK